MQDTKWHQLRIQLIRCTCVFCGCGGNAIGLDNQTDIALVICVDIDRNKLRMAAKMQKYMA